MLLVYKYKVKLTKITSINPLLNDYFTLNKNEDKVKINNEKEKVDEIDRSEETKEVNIRKDEEERVKNLLELCNMQGTVCKKIKEFLVLMIEKFAKDFSGKMLLNYFNL